MLSFSTCIDFFPPDTRGRKSLKMRPLFDDAKRAPYLCENLMNVLLKMPLSNVFSIIRVVFCLIENRNGISGRWRPFSGWRNMYWCRRPVMFPAWNRWDIASALAPHVLLAAHPLPCFTLPSQREVMVCSDLSKTFIRFSHREVAPYSFVKLRSRLRIFCLLCQCHQQSPSCWKPIHFDVTEAINGKHAKYCALSRFVTDHFSGPGRAVGQCVFVCVYVWTITKWPLICDLNWGLFLVVWFVFLHSGLVRKLYVNFQKKIRHKTGLVRLIFLVWSWFEFGPGTFALTNIYGSLDGCSRCLSTLLFQLSLIWGFCIVRKGGTMRYTIRHNDVFYVRSKADGSQLRLL